MGRPQYLAYLFVILSIYRPIFALNHKNKRT
jgi:hypothetical protein